MFRIAETTPNMETTVKKPLARSVCATAISQLLWTQHCDEEGLGETSCADAIPRTFVELGELVTNMALEPERVETAVLCMADTLCHGEFLGTLDAPDIFDMSRITQRRYLRTAQAALNTFRENVKDVPPDPQYRDEMCRLLDALAPKGGA
jgi:hypothetical protein